MVCCSSQRKLSSRSVLRDRGLFREHPEGTMVEKRGYSGKPYTLIYTPYPPEELERFLEEYDTILADEERREGEAYVYHIKDAMKMVMEEEDVKIARVSAKKVIRRFLWMSGKEESKIYYTLYGAYRLSYEDFIKFLEALPINVEIECRNFRLEVELPSGLEIEASPCCNGVDVYKNKNGNKIIYFYEYGGDGYERGPVEFILTSRGD